MKQKAILFKPKDGGATIIKLPTDLTEIYNLLEVDCIDIVKRKINGKAFQIICDDVGLLKHKPIPSAVDFYGKTLFVGNLILCGGRVTSDGDLTGLTDEEIGIINDSVCRAVDTNGTYDVIFGVYS